MKKNLLIIAVIFILPMITYFILSSEGTKAEQKVSVPVDIPVIVKFSSPLCRDCKILAKNLETVYQKYKDKIVMQNVSVEQTDADTQNMIKKYHVKLVPTLIYISDNGSVLKRTEGSLSCEQLEKNMKALIDGTLR